jgi:starch phosphorylase
MALLEEKIGFKAVATTGRRPDRGIRSLCVFTTHTPVAAGHDRFPAEVVSEILGDERAGAISHRFKRTFRELNMTELALHFSRFTNGVAMRHAQVASEMFPGHTIHPITNGVHVGTWVAPAVAALFDRYVNEWREDPLNLRSAITIPTEEVLKATAGSKRALLDEVERRTGSQLDPEVFTIGFGRRATGYKRADLIFEDPERLLAIAGVHDGLQIVYAGKAHPHDEGGKRLIRRIFAMGRELKPEVRVVYLENYDMALGRLLTSGVDVWLNNPEKPLEASGTSGMKAALNGVPNLSVLDGWWIEGHVEGVTGWSIGEDESDPTDREAESASLYDKLEKIILPLYHKDPHSYGAIRRQAMALNGPHFSAHRMMLEYVERAYGGYRRMGVRAPAARAGHG